MKYNKIVAVMALFTMTALAGDMPQGSPGAESKVYREGSAWVQEVSGSLKPAPKVKIFTEVGNVQVRGTDEQQIRYVLKKRVYNTPQERAEREFRAFQIKAWTQGEHAVVKGFSSGVGAHRASVDIEVFAPKNTVVVAESGAGGINVYSINAAVYVETAGGNISMDEIGGPIQAETSGGSIDIGKVAQAVKLETAGGSISVKSVGGGVNAATSGGSIMIGNGGGPVIVETAGGNIDVKQCGGELRASTAGGSIMAGDIGGAAFLSTAGGSIRLARAGGMVQAETAAGGIRLSRLTRGVHAETAAGGITAEFIADKKSFTESILATTFGDIIVYLPPDLGANVRASIELANGHKIYSEYGGLNISSEGGEWGPGEVWAEGAINGGGPLLKLRTTGGNIKILRGKR